MSPSQGRVLIVDDEADQVSLNTRVREGDESPTYAAIGRLRDGLGAHLYVQYTATPYHGCSGRVSIASARPIEPSGCARGVHCRGGAAARGRPRSGSSVDADSPERPR